jgi:hypothetical protein
MRRLRSPGRVARSAGYLLRRDVCFAPDKTRQRLAGTTYILSQTPVYRLSPRDAIQPIMKVGVDDDKGEEHFFTAWTCAGANQSARRRDRRHWRRCPSSTGSRPDQCLSGSEMKGERRVTVSDGLNRRRRVWDEARTVSVDDAETAPLERREALRHRALRLQRVGERQLENLALDSRSTA